MVHPVQTQTQARAPMMYLVRVVTHHGEFYLKRGELTERVHATHYDSPSAAYRAASAFALVHLKKGQLITVVRERTGEHMSR